MNESMEAKSKMLTLLEESINILRDLERLISVIAERSEGRLKGPYYGLYVDIVRLYDNILALRRLITSTCMKEH